MDTLKFIDYASHSIILLWCVWVVLSPRVQDGVVGKLIFCFAAICVYGVLFGPSGEARYKSDVMFNVAVALVGVRHVYMKYTWPWMKQRADNYMCSRRDRHGV